MDVKYRIEREDQVMDGRKWEETVGQELGFDIHQPTELIPAPPNLDVGLEEEGTTSPCHGVPRQNSWEKSD